MPANLKVTVSTDSSPSDEKHLHRDNISRVGYCAGLAHAQLSTHSQRLFESIEVYHWYGRVLIQINLLTYFTLKKEDKDLSTSTNEITRTLSIEVSFKNSQDDSQVPALVEEIKTKLLAVAEKFMSDFAHELKKASTKAEGDLALIKKEIRGTT